MGTITINVNDETEELFRKRVSQLYGKRKGSLGKALTEAIREWSKRKEYFDRCLELLTAGADLGKIKFKSRDELHDRH
ncbi:MAG: hypothetical protein V1743_05785 [Nanoarchaeota archaeon]